MAKANYNISRAFLSQGDKVRNKYCSIFFLFLLIYKTHFGTRAFQRF